MWRILARRTSTRWSAPGPRPRSSGSSRAGGRCRHSARGEPPAQGCANSSSMSSPARSAVSPLRVQPSASFAPPRASRPPIASPACPARSGSREELRPHEPVRLRETRLAPTTERRGSRAPRPRGGARPLRAPSRPSATRGVGPSREAGAGPSGESRATRRLPRGRLVGSGHRGHVHAVAGIGSGREPRRPLAAETNAGAPPNRPRPGGSRSKRSRRGLRPVGSPAWPSTAAAATAPAASFSEPPRRQPPAHGEKPRPPRPKGKASVDASGPARPRVRARRARVGARTGSEAARRRAEICRAPLARRAQRLAARRGLSCPRRRSVERGVLAPAPSGRPGRRGRRGGRLRAGGGRRPRHRCRSHCRRRRGP